MFNDCSYEAYGNMDAGTVVYADPPYSNTEAGYNGGWTVDDDVKLARFIMDHMRYKWIVSSCAKDGNTTKLVEILRASGAFDERRIDYTYKASKKTKESKTEEILLVSK
jgi:site-specific DNA-adenine methylase